MTRNEWYVHSISRAFVALYTQVLSSYETTHCKFMDYFCAPTSDKSDGVLRLWAGYRFEGERFLVFGNAIPFNTQLRRGI